MEYHATHFVVVVGIAKVSQGNNSTVREVKPELSRRNEAKWLTGLLLLAVVIRIGVVITFYGDYEPVSDAKQFDSMAKNFLHGRGLITVWNDEEMVARRTPVPALYMATIYAISGESVFAVQLANALLGSVTIWFAYDLIRAIFGVTPARWAGLLIAFYPLFSHYSSQLLSETPVLFLVALSLWLAWWARGGGLTRYLLLGTVIGLAALTRQTALALAPFIAVWIFQDGKREWRHRLVGPLILLAGTVMILAPWTLRNYNVLGKFIPLTSLGGLSLWIANNPNAEGTPRDHSIYLQVPELDSLQEVERGAAYQKLAINFIQEHPLHFAKLAFRRLQWFWHIGYHGEGATEVLFLVMYLPTLGLAIMGVVVGWRLNRDAVLLLLTVPFSLTAMHMVFLPVGRYRLPAELILCMLAGLAAAGCAQRIPGHRKTKKILARIGLGGVL